MDGIETSGITAGAENDADIGDEIETALAEERVVRDVAYGEVVVVATHEVLLTMMVVFRDLAERRAVDELRQENKQIRTKVDGFRLFVDLAADANEGTTRDNGLASSFNELSRQGHQVGAARV